MTVEQQRRQHAGSRTRTSRHWTAWRLRTRTTPPGQWTSGDDVKSPRTGRTQRHALSTWARRATWCARSGTPDMAAGTGWHVRMARTPGTCTSLPTGTRCEASTSPSRTAGTTSWRPASAGGTYGTHLQGTANRHGAVGTTSTGTTAGAGATACTSVRRTPGAPSCMRTVTGTCRTRG